MLKRPKKKKDPKAIVIIAIFVIIAIILAIFVIPVFFSGVFKIIAWLLVAVVIGFSLELS